MLLNQREVRTFMYYKEWRLLCPGIIHLISPKCSISYWPHQSRDSWSCFLGVPPVTFQPCDLSLLLPEPSSSKTLPVCRLATQISSYRVRYLGKPCLQVKVKVPSLWSDVLWVLQATRLIQWRLIKGIVTWMITLTLKFYACGFLHKAEWKSFVCYCAWPTADCWVSIFLLYVSS